MLDADLHLRGVLSADELSRLNTIYSDRLQAELGERLLSEERLGAPAAGTRRHSFATQTTADDGSIAPARKFWSAAYADLLNHAAIAPIVQELICDPQHGHVPRPAPPHRGRYTLDHDNIHYHAAARDASDTGGSLHSPRLDKNPAKAACRCECMLTVMDSMPIMMGCVLKAMGFMQAGDCRL